MLRAPTPLRPPAAALLLLAALIATGPRAAICQVPDDADQLERRAEELYAADRLEEAASLYIRLADLVQPEAEQARALVLAAWLQTLRGRPDLATRTLDDALARDPGYQMDPQSFSDTFHRTFEQLRQARSASTDLPTGASLNEGLDLLRSGDLAGARSIFEEAAAQDPQDEQVQFLLARIESRLGESDSALRRLSALSARIDQGELLSVDRAEIDAELGVSAYRAGDANAAAEAFSRAVAANPQDAASWQNLGLARSQLGDLNGAAVAFRRALDLDATQPELARLLANTLLRLGRDSEALPLLRRLAGEGSSDARVWLDLGLAEQREGSPDGAARALARAAELDSQNELEIGVLALAQRAVLLLDSGQSTAAADVARQALAMDRGNVDALNVLGLAQLDDGDTEEAATNLERARALAPERADLANNLGKALFAAQRMEEAVEAFEAAVALDPSLQTAADNLEVARRALDGTAAPRAASTDRESSTGPTQQPPRQTSADAGSGEPRVLGARLTDVRHAGTGRDAVRVSAVTAGGLAERAGLRDGDLILRVAGQGVGVAGFENAAAIERRLSEMQPGASIRLDLFRGQEALAVTIQR